MISDFLTLGVNFGAHFLSESMVLINLFCLPGFQGIVPISYAGVQIFKFLYTCQKLPPKVDPIFSAFFDNYCKNSPKQSASGSNFFCVTYCRIGIPKRNAQLYQAVSAGDLGSQAPKV